MSRQIELVGPAGYVSVKKTETERLNFTAFLPKRFLEAKGRQPCTLAAAGVGQGGRKLSYVTKVQFNGNLLIAGLHRLAGASSPAMNSRSSWAKSRYPFCLPAWCSEEA